MTTPVKHRFEHELKYVFPASRAAEVLTRLKALAAPDPGHPANVVASIYYDTPGLDSLYEKLDSHRTKAKYRLRWYEETGRGPGEGPSFLEVKYREGRWRAKHRSPAALPASRLAGASLLDPELAGLPAGFWAMGVAPSRGLSPCVTIRYRRHRFVDRAGSTRLNLDTEIRLTAADPRRLPPATRPALPVAILEVKNLEGRMPHHLAGLLAPGWRLASFSKYAACFLAAHGNRRILLDPS